MDLRASRYIFSDKRLTPSYVHVRERSIAFFVKKKKKGYYYIKVIIIIIIIIIIVIVIIISRLFAYLRQ
jgi:hypothetical protein